MFYMNDMGQPSQENYESTEYMTGDENNVSTMHQTIFRWAMFFTILAIILFFLKKIFIRI